MSKIKNIAEIKAYIEGEDDDGEFEETTIQITSHWLDRDKVTVTIDPTKSWVVYGEDLIQAIKNCMNVGV